MVKKLLIAFLSVLGLSLAFVTPAFAGTGNQYCYQNGNFACANAWSGGPRVNAYTGGPNTPNNDFTVINNFATGDKELKYTGNSGQLGLCIGDFGNSSSDASTGLVGCGNGGEGAGWGTNMQIGTGSGCPSGQVWMFDTHWQGFLGPPNGWVNGSHMFLNKTQRICFVVSGAA